MSSARQTHVTFAMLILAWILAWTLTSPLGGAFSIFLLGLAFSCATYRSQSVVGGMVAHFVNNLAA